MSMSMQSYQLAHLVGQSYTRDVQLVLEGVVAALVRHIEEPKSGVMLELMLQGGRSAAGLGNEEVAHILCAALQLHEQALDEMAAQIVALGKEECIRRLDAALLALRTLA